MACHHGAVKMAGMKVNVIPQTRRMAAKVPEKAGAPLWLTPGCTGFRLVLRPVFCANS